MFECRSYRTPIATETDKDSAYFVLRNRVGSGSYNYSSKDITTSFGHGGTATYSLHVTSSVGGGVLEEFALSFTLRTSPIKTDSDGDALNDSEETTYGVDAWITDPNRVDTDFDAWSDSYEIQTKGTSPLAWDTDGDGSGDSSDLDPLRNLLVAVKVKKVHHGASPWCTPELVGTARVNGDYTWVTEHRMASEDVYWSGGCLSDIASTAVFWVEANADYMTYYADVPDGTSSVSVRGTGWSVNGARWDDPLVDGTVGYTLLSGTAPHTVWNGNSWMSFDVWTHALPKAKTFLITDGNATVAASNGERRLTGQDRYLVFAFNVTSASAPFVVCANTIVVPRSIFLDSKLKADFAANNHWPLADATLYGDDLGKADVSEGVAGVIAKSLSGLNAYNVLDRLLRSTTNVLTYSYVDITSYAVRANLPADVVRILPWETVTNGPTGTPPDGMPGFINVLVQLGQLFYKGLVGLVTFLVNLGEAIADWGMRFFGSVSNYVGGVVQQAGELLSRFVDWVIRFAVEVAKAALDPLLAQLRSMTTLWASWVIAAAANSFSEFAQTKGQTPSTLAQLAASFLLPTAAIAGAVAVGLLAVGTAIGPVAYIAAAVAGVIAGVVIGSLVGNSVTISRQVPAPSSPDQTVMRTLAVDTRATTVPAQSQSDDIQLDTTLDWILVVVPAVLSVIFGAAATGVPDILEYVSIALVVPSVMIAILADAALRYSNDQGLVNRVATLYGAIAVLGVVFDLAALIWGIYSKSPGGALLAAVGIALGLYGWWASDQYLQAHPLR